LTGLKKLHFKHRYFLVEHYKNNTAVHKKINEYVFKNLPAGYEKYAQYGMTFFKQSGETNLENIKKNPRIIVRYSERNDIVFSNEWLYRQHYSFNKFVDGESTSPPDTSVHVYDVK